MGADGLMNFNIQVHDELYTQGGMARKVSGKRITGYAFLRED